MDILVKSENQHEPHQGFVQKILSTIPELLFEVVCIVISILLALWLGGKAEDAKNQKIGLSALSNFKEELQSNQATLKQTLTLYQGYVKKIEALKPPIANFNDVGNQIEWKGLGALSIYSTAWETAVATNTLSFIDYDTVKRLSGIYIKQKEREFILQKFLDMFYNPSILKDENVSAIVNSMHFMLAALVTTQENLLTDYETILKKIDERYPELKTMDALETEKSVPAK